MAASGGAGGDLHRHPGALRLPAGARPAPSSDRMTIHWAQVFGAAGLGGFRLLPAEGHLITRLHLRRLPLRRRSRLLARSPMSSASRPASRPPTAHSAWRPPRRRRRGDGAGDPDRHAGLRTADRRPGDAISSRSDGRAPRLRRRPGAGADRGRQRIQALPADPHARRRRAAPAERHRQVDPDSIASYREHGGYAGLERAIDPALAGGGHRPDRGRRTARPWRRRVWHGREVASCPWRPGERKVVVANLMGADPTALGDRALAEGNPHLVVEGVLIAAFAIGASEAIVAVRRDWTVAVERLRKAVAEAEAAASPATWSWAPTPASRSACRRAPAPGRRRGDSAAGGARR